MPTYQVGGADDFHDGERGGGGGQERRQPQGRGANMHQNARADAKSRDRARPQAQSGAAPDNVQSVRAGSDVQEQAGQYEEPEIMST
jgi:hypothetical protein